MMAGMGNGSAKELVRAAGGVVWRRADDGGVELVVVHRPRYDDWTLPKGKAERDESDEDAAVREVEEETGIRCRLGHELARVQYTDNKGRPKQVRFWEMTPKRSVGAFRANDEVDKLRWVTVKAAEPLLSYPRDREVLRAFDRFITANRPGA